MTDHQTGPPEGERPAPSQDRPSAEIITNARHGNRPRTFMRPATLKPLPRICPTDVAGQLRARRVAANRSVPLHCGCRDPLVCDCYRTEPPLSQRALDGWRDAALNVLSVGELPLLPIEVRRELWKRGGADRVLAERLHQACGGEAA